MNPEVNWFFEKDIPWRRAYQQLRGLMLSSPLREELKWGNPCYTHEGANVVLIHGFKAYCALLFFKGALLKDEKGLLVQQTRNVQSARQMRFSEESEITKRARDVKTYVREAIEIEKSGLKVKFKSTADFEVPEEFQSILEKDKKVQAAFRALTPGRQRGYLFYFGQAKQSKTRAARVEKCLPKIRQGKGLDD